MASVIGQALIDIVKCEVLGGEAPEPRILKLLLNTQSGDEEETARTPFDDMLDLAEINGIIQLVADFFLSKKPKGNNPKATGKTEKLDEFLIEKNSPAYKRLKEAYDAELYRSLTFGTDLSRIGMILEKEGIDYIPLKGAIIRDIYPKPWMRTSTDMDILVRDEDLDRAVEAITSQPGFMKVNENGHHVLIESKTGWIIELHFSLNAGGSKAEKTLRTAWDHAKPFGEIFTSGAMPVSNAFSKSTHKYALEIEFFYTYFIYHLAHHVSDCGGCGIRAILDLYILNEKLGSKLTAQIENMLSQNGLLEFAKKMSAIADLWFGKGVAIEEMALAPEQLEEIERFIIIGGTHGTKKSSALASHYASGDKHKKNRIFLSYESLSRRYRGLQGRRYLTPVYEVKRWASALTTGGAKRAKESFALDENISEEEASRTARIMETIGLGKKN